MPKVRIAAKLGKHRETVHLWVKGIQKYGLIPFLDRYEQAKKGKRRSRQVDPILKRWAWTIREREMQCCGQKIQYFLELEYGIHLSVPKVYEILAEKYVIRSRWKKNHSRGPILAASRPREVIQMDTIDFGGLYAFTAIDIFTREADVLIAPGSLLKMACASSPGAWSGALGTTFTLFKPTADQSSRLTSLPVYLPTVTGTVLLDHIARMNSPT